MKKLLPLILLFLTISALGQTAELATATYASNGKLLSLTNLSSLSDCESMNVTGPVKKIKVKENVVTFRLGKRGSPNIEVNLDRLAADERKVVLRDMIRARYTLRVAGYSCKSNLVITAFSIYRI